MTQKEKATQQAENVQQAQPTQAQQEQPTQATQQATSEDEESLRQIRKAIVGYYANNAFDVFRNFVELNDDEFSEFMRVTENATIVFTQPTQQALADDAKAETPRFKKGRKFGTEQWYKKSQVVGLATAVLSSYSSYVRYMDSKQNAAERDAKRLENAANTFAAMSAEEQKAYIARLQAMLAK